MANFFIQGEEMNYEIGDRGCAANVEEFANSEAVSVTYLNHLYSREIYIPISIFKSDLAPLQAIVKYLIEVELKNNAQASKILKRDTRTVWLTYRKVKDDPALRVDLDGVVIPISAIADSQGSVLESIVVFLHRQGHSFTIIAKMLDRDVRTIWTCFSRAKNKGVTL